MKNRQSLMMDNSKGDLSRPEGLCTCVNQRAITTTKGNKTIPDSHATNTSRIKSKTMDSTSNSRRFSNSTFHRQLTWNGLWTFGLCFAVIWTFHTAYGQDTRLLEHTGYGKKGHFHCSKHCSSLMASLEQRLHHRIRDVDHRCNKRIENAIDANNKTAAIQHTEKLLHHVIEEVQISRESQLSRGADFEKLRQTVSNQQHEIHRSKNTIDRLEKQVTELSGLVERLLEDQRNLTERLEDALSRQTQAPPTSGAATSSSQPAPTTGVTTTTTADELPFRPLFPIDCQDVYDNHGGRSYPGLSYLMIQPYTSTTPFEVCCKMTNESGWTVIQRRVDGSVDFYKTWDEYKRGFGNLQTEFWLGNDHIHQLTSQGDYMLRIEMEDWEGRSYWAEYEHFKISDEASKYRLHVHGYRGTAGDSMTVGEKHDNQPFSTHDRDHDSRFYDNCAEHYHGAWWFRSCFRSHLNGKYYTKGLHNNYFVRNGIQWNSIHIHSSLKKVMMMIKPTDSVRHEEVDPVQNQI